MGKNVKWAVRFEHPSRNKEGDFEKVETPMFNNKDIAILCMFLLKINNIDGQVIKLSPRLTEVIKK